MDVARIAETIAHARSEGRDFLLEHEGFALLEAVGISVPFHRVVAGPEVLEGLDLDAFPGERVVLKVVSADIQHKSDIGGVAVVARTHAAVRTGLVAMAAQVAARAPRARLAGFLVCAHVAHETSLGHEMLLGLRWTEDLGPVAVFGPGGIHTEFLSRTLREGRDLAILSPFLGCAAHRAGGAPGDGDGAHRTGDDTHRAGGAPGDGDGAHRAEVAAHRTGGGTHRVGGAHGTGGGATGDGGVARALREAAITPLLTAGLRGQPPVVELETLVAIVAQLLDLARRFLPTEISELEVNPLVVATPPPSGVAPAQLASGAASSVCTSEGTSPAGSSGATSSAWSSGSVASRLVAPGLVALDVLVRLGRPAKAGAPPRPLRKIDALLHPRTIALAGVSTTQSNPGRVILDNILAGGFDPTRLWVLHPDAGEIAGVACVPSPGQLPERVDLAVLSVAAATLPAMVTEFIETERAESLIVIPGGLEEKAGSEEIVARMRSALWASRTTAWGGPVINGGNCLGIQSRPGRYDTVFIPRHKLPVPRGEAAPIALVCQSGAHMVANLDRLGGIAPRYAISAGNQMDLTVGDYLTYLADDPEIRVFACYVEGFRPLDGLAFFTACEKITASGRTVLLYLASRTPAGAQASASHTASLAGDYAVLRAAARQAGVVLAKNLANFADLLQLFALLGDREVAGTRLGAISNAGFECVAIADAMGAFQLASFAPATRQRLQDALVAARIEAIVDVHNPLDLTPMSNDAVYAEAIAAVLEDDGVDVGVVGIVPLTPALQTLEPGPGHREDLRSETALAGRMAELRKRIRKPWVAVVDAGRRYDPFARELEAGGIPTFRTADRAVRLLEAFVGERLRTRRPDSAGR